VEPLTRSILRLTVCWAADSLSPLPRKYLSNMSNSFRISQRALFSLLRLYAFFSFVLPVYIHITDLIADDIEFLYNEEDLAENPEDAESIRKVISKVSSKMCNLESENNKILSEIKNFVIKFLTE
jgi:hypothetical protein